MFMFNISNRGGFDSEVCWDVWIFEHPPNAALTVFNCEVNFPWRYFDSPPDANDWTSPERNVVQWSHDRNQSGLNWFIMCSWPITCRLEPSPTESRQPCLGKSYCPGPCSLPENIQTDSCCVVFLRGSEGRQFRNEYKVKTRRVYKTTYHWNVTCFVLKIFDNWHFHTTMY